MRFGYKASAEQFAPVELLEYAALAERVGLESVAISDHFQPWRHNGGHGPAALSWLGAVGQRTSTVSLGTSVLTPTLRYHPSVIAQHFATLACLTPNRVFLGVGTGEALNETAPTGFDWPGGKERRRRQAEQMEPGDRIVLFATRALAFAATVRLTSGMFEDRAPVWPVKPGRADQYPWRFRAEPELVLDEQHWLPAQAVNHSLEHVGKWPAEHWTLAYQGQLRTVSEHDARVLLDAMGARTGAGAGLS